MLTVYRRHNPALCKSTDRYYKRCTCPAWVEGTVGGKYVRRSLKTHSWERAVAKVRKMDATEDPTPPPAKKDGTCHYRKGRQRISGRRQGPRTGRGDPLQAQHHLPETAPGVVQSRRLQTPS